MSSLVNIPNGWEETILDDVTHKITDGSHQSPKAFEGGFPMLSVKDMNEYGFDIKNSKTISESDYLKLVKQGCRPEVNDILIAKDGSVLKHIFKVDEEIDAVLLSSIAIVKPNIELINPDYLVYLLLNPVFKKYIINNFLSGSGVPRIVLKDFKKIIFNLPSLPEQKAIANILTAFDDKIENLQAQNKTLEQTAQTIFAAWFGKYQVGDELPEGWRVGKLSEIAEFLNGLALQKYPPIAGEKTLPVIKIRELKQGITSNTDKANTHLDKKYIIQNGDVLFSWSGSLEVVIWQNGKGALNQHLFKVSSEEFPKWFYYFWILHHLREFKGVAANKATTMGHINRKHLDLAEVIIPDEVSLKKYNQIFNPLIKKLENNHQKIQTLKKTRDTLLPKLMSGQLRVNDFKD